MLGERVYLLLGLPRVCYVCQLSCGLDPNHRGQGTAAESNVERRVRVSINVEEVLCVRRFPKLHLLINQGAVAALVEQIFKGLLPVCS